MFLVYVCNIYIQWYVTCALRICWYYLYGLQACTYIRQILSVYVLTNTYKLLLYSSMKQSSFCESNWTQGLYFTHWRVWSSFSINKASILQQLDNFDVTKCLPFDIMHTVYEGMAVYHLNLLLHYLIDTRKWLSLTSCYSSTPLWLHWVWYKA